MLREIGKRRRLHDLSRGWYVNRGITVTTVTDSWGGVTDFKSSVV